jgi:hypothetical protein
VFVPGKPSACLALWQFMKRMSVPGKPFQSGNT